MGAIKFMPGKSLAGFNPGQGGLVNESKQSKLSAGGTDYVYHATLRMKTNSGRGMQTYLINHFHVSFYLNDLKVAQADWDLTNVNQGKYEFKSWGVKPPANNRALFVSKANAKASSLKSKIIKGIGSIGNAT